MTAERTALEDALTVLILELSKLNDAFMLELSKLEREISGIESDLSLDAMARGRNLSEY